MIELHVPRLKVNVKITKFTIDVVRSIFPEYFIRFSLNFTQMVLSMIQYMEHMTQLFKLKVEVKSKIKGFNIRVVRNISHDLFRRFSIKYTPNGMHQGLHCLLRRERNKSYSVPIDIYNDHVCISNKKLH